MQAMGGYTVYWTDASVVVDGSERPGIPFILDWEMKPVADINAYLYEECFYGNLVSHGTRDKAARNMVTLLDFCERKKKHWTEIQRKEMYQFRDYILMGKKKKRGRPATNECLSRVCNLFTWGLENHKIRSLPFRYRTVSMKRIGPFTYRNAKVNELTLKTLPPITQFLRKDQVPLFFRELTDGTDRLMAREGFQIGMRRDEITRQTVDVLPDPSKHPDGQMIAMVLDPKLTPTKGNRLREVLLTPKLAKALWDYKEKARPLLAEKYRRKFGRETRLLFLSQSGDPLPTTYLNKVFKKAAMKAGFRVTPHMLRHTYATFEFLRVAEKFPELQALEWVRDRLGHASVSTTERYIHSAKLVCVKLMVDYQKHIDDMIAGGEMVA